MTTSDNVYGNVVQSIRKSLNGLADAGHIQYNPPGQEDGPWKDRFDAFFSALKSWDKGTLQSGLDAAFAGVPDAPRLKAEAEFYESFSGGTPGEPTKPKKRAKGIANALGSLGIKTEK